MCGISRISSTAMDGHDTVIHLASNPDIARAVTDPAVDFDQGTLLTHHVAEAARRCGVGLVLYASGSGVYGDLGEREASRGLRAAGSGVDLRSEQASGRGAHRVLLRPCSASLRWRSDSATSLAHARHTAWASTSSVVCSTTRAACAYLVTGSRASPMST